MRACVRVPIFSNDSCIGLGYDSGVSTTIFDNMVTHAHSIHGPCSYIISNANMSHLEKTFFSSSLKKNKQPTGVIMPIAIVYHENLYVNFTNSKYLVIRLQNINVIYDHISYTRTHTIQTADSHVV